MENKRRRRKVGEQTAFVSFGENHFTRLRFLRENFPAGRAVGGDGLPPFGRVAMGRRRFRGRMAGGDEHECRSDQGKRKWNAAHILKGNFLPRMDTNEHEFGIGNFLTAKSPKYANKTE